MSRNYRSGEQVSHGSGASLDNLTAGDFWGWAWVYKGEAGANQNILSKEAVITAGWFFDLSTSPGEGSLRFVSRRATTPVQFVGGTGNVGLDLPTFVAFSFDTGASPLVHLYTGTQASAVAEVASYNTSDNGSGAFGDDAAANCWTGNLQRATTSFFHGSIQMGGIGSGSVLSLSNFETIRGLTLNAVNTDSDLSDVQAAFAHVLLFNYQAGSVADRSGTGNNGTNNGSQSGPDFPIATSSGGGGLRLAGHGGLAA